MSPRDPGRTLVGTSSRPQGGDGPMSGLRTLFDKLWSDHVIVVSPQGEDLLYVDFNLINEGQSFLAFDQLRMEGRKSRRPRQHLAVTDHTCRPSTGRSAPPACTIPRSGVSSRCSTRTRRNSRCRISAGIIVTRALRM